MYSKFGWKSLILIIVGLVLLALLVYMWDFWYKIDSPLLTSILAGFIIVAATVLGIDRLLAHRERVKWNKVKASVVVEITSCLNGILTNTRALAGIDSSELG